MKRLIFERKGQSLIAITPDALQTGDFVRTRHRGAWEYAIVRNPINGMDAREIIAESSIPKGAKITQCIWKGERLQPRGSYTQQTGPAVYTAAVQRTWDEIFGSDAEQPAKVK